MPHSSMGKQAETGCCLQVRNNADGLWPTPPYMWDYSTNSPLYIPMSKLQKGPSIPAQISAIGALCSLCAALWADITTITGIS